MVFKGKKILYINLVNFEESPFWIKKNEKI